MNCSCANGAKVKPTQYCAFCVHKHLSTALALSEFVTAERRAIDFRVAAQVNLAVLHMTDRAEEFRGEIAFCHGVIASVVRKGDFREGLCRVTSHFWEAARSASGAAPARSWEAAEALSDGSIDFALLKVSAAIELMRYEISYEGVNFSTAIGQLVCAGWALGRLDRQLGEECRGLCHRIEGGQARRGGGRSLPRPGHG